MSSHQHSCAEVEARLAAIEGQLVAKPARRIGKVPRRLRAVIPVVLVLALAPVVLASDRFSDVPDSNQFHDNINNIAAAGVTSGCGGGKYCPKDPVPREQMAAFLNRIGGRAAVANFFVPLGNTPGQQPANNATVASTTITVIGHQALDMRANFYTFTYSGSGTFPCEIVYRFRIDGLLIGSSQMFDRYIAAPASTWETKTISGEYLLVVPPGTYTVSLTYQRVANSCSSYPGNGTLVVETIPFRQDGKAWAGLAAASDDGILQLTGQRATQSNGEPID